MLIATITALLLILGGGGGKYLGFVGKYVSDFVEDDARAERAEAIVATMQAEKQAFAEKIIDLRGRLFNLDVHRSATRYEYRQVFLDLDREWNGFEGRFLDRWYELREVVERDEWNALFDKVEKKMGRR